MTCDGWQRDQHKAKQTYPVFVYGFEYVGGTIGCDDSGASFELCQDCIKVLEEDKTKFIRHEYKGVQC